MTDINHMLQVFEDCLTVIFSSALFLFHDSPPPPPPPPTSLCKAGGKRDKIYIYDDGQKKGEKAFVRLSHLFRTTEHRDGSHSGQNLKNKNKNKTKKAPVTSGQTLDKRRQ